MCSAVTMLSRKALFFDVDGTLLSEKSRTVPESAVKAISQARKNGHLVFINSGRTYCLLGSIEQMVEADGYLCGCGTQVMIEGKTVFSKQISRERGNQIKKDLLSHNLDGCLEAKEAIYFRKEHSRFPQLEQIRKNVREQAVECDWLEREIDFDKMCVYADELSDKDGFFKTMEEDFEIIDRGGQLYEIIPKGYSKATAVQCVLDYYQMPLEDAYVFGDSTNDLAMFQYAKNAVLMGEHSKELEPYATFVTKKVEEDGIAYAMEQLGLI